MEFGVADPDHVAPPQFRGGRNGLTLQGHRKVFGARVDVELARIRFVADESAERSRGGPQRLGFGIIGCALRRAEPRWRRKVNGGWFVVHLKAACQRIVRRTAFRARARSLRRPATRNRRAIIAK